MDLKTLVNKTRLATKLLMVQPSMIFRFLSKDKDMGYIQEELTVQQGEDGRPDLVALRAYGDESKIDMILKFNGISDPFSIKEGDILFIPRDSTPYYKLERPETQDENPIRAQYMNSKRIPAKDNARLAAMKKKYNKETLLPPNVVPAGKKTYQFTKKGTVILGAQAQNGDATATNTPDYKGLTREEALNMADKKALIEAQRVEALLNAEAANTKKIIPTNDLGIGQGVDLVQGGSADVVGTNNLSSGNPSGASSSTSGLGNKC
jgi:hypothetical protein